MAPEPNMNPDLVPAPGVAKLEPTVGFTSRPVELPMAGVPERGAYPLKRDVPAAAAL